jgi:hypothetical protein
VNTKIRSAHREYATRFLAAVMKLDYEQLVALDLSDEALVANVDKTFHSEEFGPGFAGLKLESDRFDNLTGHYISPSETKTIFQQVRDLRNEIPLEDHNLLRLRPYEEYLTVHIEESACWVVIRRAKVTEKTRRDFVETSLQLIKWEMKTEDLKMTWERSSVTIPDDTSNFELLRYGRANTAQHVADQRWQERNCYRSAAKEA